jgi:hypothetical protein
VIVLSSLRADHTDDEIRRLLAACEGRGLEDRRDTAGARGASTAQSWRPVLIVSLDPRHELARVEGLVDRRCLPQPLTKAIPAAAPLADRFEIAKGHRLRYVPRRCRGRPAGDPLVVGRPEAAVDPEEISVSRFCAIITSNTPTTKSCPRCLPAKAMPYYHP